MRFATVRLPGHPDAICDVLAETVVDAYLERDPQSRVRISVHGGGGAIFVSGDVFSSADFDVSRILQNRLGELGYADRFEIFVTLDVKNAHAHGSAVVSESDPVHVVGVAFRETEERIPITVQLATRIAKHLESKRQNDPEWFWLGADGIVTVFATSRLPSQFSVEIEHGNEPLDRARSKIIQALRHITSDLPIAVNANGVREQRGIERVSGTSHRTPSPYGTLAPALPSLVGRHVLSPEKGGTWLARHVARTWLEATPSANVVWVRALYAPGESQPSAVRIHDDRGVSIPVGEARSRFDIRAIPADWQRGGISTDAVRWGFAGDTHFPWEQSRSV